VQAALASAATFAIGAGLPLLLVFLLPMRAMTWGVAMASLAFLTLLGMLAARAGGSPVFKSALRVTFWGALAMGLTATVGALFGATL
jgi:VIT1/CCC1 family predicted Fe2+/Mn2+ transporter